MEILINKEVNLKDFYDCYLGLLSGTVKSPSGKWLSLSPTERDLMSFLCSLPPDITFKAREGSWKALAAKHLNRDKRYIHAMLERLQLRGVVQRVKDEWIVLEGIHQIRKALWNKVQYAEQELNYTVKFNIIK